MFGLLPATNAAASILASSSSLRSRMRLATRNIGTPACLVPKNSPGPRSSRSSSAIWNPSCVRTISSSRRSASGVMLASAAVMSTQYDFAAPRPMRPRSWCICERPKRSACSTTITLAFGTSTPTSMTVVETSTSILPAWNAAMKQTNAQLGQGLAPQLVIHRCRGLEIEPLAHLLIQLRSEFTRREFDLSLRITRDTRAFDHGIDNVSLASGLHLLAHELPDFAGALVGHATRRDRRASRGQFIDDARLHIAVECERQRSRDRSCRHNERIWLRPAALLHQLVALHHAEAVLFV